MVRKTVSADAVVYFRIFNPIISVTNVENSRYSTQLLAATTLRNILGTKTLQEILSDLENISHSMQVHLDEGTDTWGVKVESVQLEPTPERPSTAISYGALGGRYLTTGI
ncbi:unnamed protein product [Didymodactylos carnosus]|uniref:Band 7 domain-containing protein n=1 Tax=Didymodactylos carnosus TaxID=1234261 RepID=A0A814WGC9_9BILA|nr:unnamed protein product [Didymodactylos carnosus]CAF1201068.1 unnamed protein product [Didymodactylos carnosus]CAF3545042.1 unnamed protein product [Didymodactylos carnosus]CAF3965571.1 unnamed protein product [Didymodactylos carnosus]